MNALQQAQLLKSHALLRTKLALPRLRSPLVPRERLLSRLEAGLEHKLTLVSAPAGFGKTTLAVEWAYRRMNDVAWLSLDSGDNDPVRFWRYVIAACQTFGDGIGSSALSILQASQEPAFEALLTDLINELSGLPGNGVLILEDYHLITSPQIHKSLAFLIDHLPGFLHLMLLTRTDPPLPLGRLRARDELAELRATDLRFSQDEIEAFIRQVEPQALSPQAVARLAERTEGWAAGVHLVMLTLQGRQEPAELEHFLVSFGGAHRPIQEYLIHEVLGAQPADLQQFLLQTAFLDRLTASLCDAVTGRKDSAAILEQIERANLFLVPLDASAEYYRYHALFAEALQHAARERLGEDYLCELQYKASVWYEEHGLLAEAVEAHLSAREYQHAARLIEQLITPDLMQNEHYTLRRWIAQIPTEELYTHPALCFSYATSILFTSDRRSPATHALLQEPLNVAEAAWRSEKKLQQLGELLAFRSIAAWVQGNVAQAISNARQALEFLPEDNVRWRGISLIFIGGEQQLSGKLHAARQTLTEARALCMAAGNAYGTFDATNLLAQVYASQAESGQAAQLYRWILAEAEQARMERDQALLRKARALTGLAELALEKNDLDAAEEHASQALEISQKIADEDLHAHASLAQVRLKQANGETAQAQELLQALIANTQKPALLGKLFAVQAELDLASGDLASVQRWADARRASDSLALTQREQEDLIVSRLRIVQGRPGEALPILEDLAPTAREEGRVRSELDAKILLALAFSALGDRPQAQKFLVQALELARPEGIQRPFLEQGEAMRVLLLDCRLLLKQGRREQLLAFSDRLLGALASGERLTGERMPSGSPISAARDPAMGNLIEPLSEQEQRILRLLAAGLSNPEIAQELFISVNTVKTHVKSIYRKLNVTSRREVRQAARGLDLK